MPFEIGLSLSDNICFLYSGHNIFEIPITTVPCRVLMTNIEDFLINTKYGHVVFFCLSLLLIWLSNKYILWTLLIFQFNGGVLLCRGTIEPRYWRYTRVVSNVNVSWKLLKCITFGDVILVLLVVASLCQIKFIKVWIIWLKSNANWNPH